MALLCAPRRDPDLPEAARNADGSAAPEIPIRLHDNAGGFMVAALALNFLGFFVGFGHQFFLVRLATLPELAMTLPEQSNLHALRMLAGGCGYAVGLAWTGWQWRVWPFWTIGAMMLVVTLAGTFAPGVAVLAAAIALGGAATSMCNQLSLFYSIGGGAVRRGRGAGLTESALALGGACGPLFGGIAAVLVGTPRAALIVPLIPLAACVAIWLKALPRRAPPPDCA
jgi:hypothetical protein